MKEIKTKYRSDSNVGYINTKWSEWVESGGLSNYLNKTYGTDYVINYMDNDYVEIFIDDEHYHWIADESYYKDYFLMVDFKDEYKLDVDIEELIDFEKVDFSKMSEMVDYN